MDKDRKGAGPRNAAEKSRQLTQELQFDVGATVRQYIKDNPKTWFADLPDGVKASIIQGQLPKPQVTSQDADAAFLSLTSSTSLLPDIPDLTAEIVVLRREAQDARKQAQYWQHMCTQLEKEVKRKGISDLAWMRPLVLKVYEDGIEAGKEHKARPISEDEYNKIIERKLNQSTPAPVELST